MKFKSLSPQHPVNHIISWRWNGRRHTDIVSSPCRPSLSETSIPSHFSKQSFFSCNSWIKNGVCGALAGYSVHSSGATSGMLESKSLSEMKTQEVMRQTAAQSKCLATELIILTAGAVRQSSIGCSYDIVWFQTSESLPAYEIILGIQFALLWCQMTAVCPI